MESVDPVELDQPVCRDSDDDVILAIALAGHADCIVTGDKDLLVIQRYKLVDILSPSQFPAFEATKDG